MMGARNDSPTVLLVDAGPGGPELLTVRTIEPLGSLAITIVGDVVAAARELAAGRAD